VDDATTDVSEAPRKRATWKTWLSAAVGLIIVLGVFLYAIPKFADYGDVWNALQTLTPIEFWSLFAAMLFNLYTYWLANQAALPGLRIAKSAVVTQTTTTVANTLPAGGAIAIGLTYSILNSWGFSATAVALYVGVTGIWNIFAKLALPVVALALLVFTGRFDPGLVAAAFVGVAVLIVAVALLAALFRSEHLARRVGDGIGAVISKVLGWFHRPPRTGMGDAAVRFRSDTIGLVERRWIRLTWTTILSQLALCFVLILSLRHMGVAEQELPTVEILAVFSFSRLLSAIPLTPGGVGVIDLGYIAGLTAMDQGEHAQIVAGVLLFRALTFAIQIPIGIFTYWIWRAKGSWRREVVEQPPAEPAPAKW